MCFYMHMTNEGEFLQHKSVHFVDCELLEDVLAG